MSSLPKKKMNVGTLIFKSKWTALAVGGFFIWGIGFGMGNIGAKVPLKDEKVTYDELASKITKKKKN